MTRVIKSVILSAEPTKVVDYIASVANHPAFISALKKVENVKGDTRGTGATWDWTFVMGGVEVKGKAERTDFVPGKSFGFRTTTGIKSTFNYRVEPAKGSRAWMSTMSHCDAVVLDVSQLIEAAPTSGEVLKHARGLEGDARRGPGQGRGPRTGPCQGPGADRQRFHAESAMGGGATLRRCGRRDLGPVGDAMRRTSPRGAEGLGHRGALDPPGNRALP